MKTTVKTTTGRNITVMESLVPKHGAVITISLQNYSHDMHGAMTIDAAAVLGQALLDLAQKIENDKLCPAALTSGIDWQQVNRIARGDA